MVKEMTTQKILLHLAVLHHGDWNEIYKDIVVKKDYEPDQVEETFQANKDNFITILDNEYPDQLKQSYKPPFVLFYQGNIRLLKDKNKTIVAIGNSRHSDKQDQEIAKSILNGKEGEELVYVLTAKTEMDETIIKSKHPCICVLDMPLDNQCEWLREEILNNGGLVLTEYPHGTNLDKNMCMSKYRIMSGISQKALILTSAKQSSVNLLVSYSLQQGHDIMVVPTSPLNTLSRNNEYISQGAIPVWNRETFLDNVQH